MSQLQINVCSSYNDYKTMEEQIQCHGLRDGGHSIYMAEYHDPVFMFLYVINNMFRDMRKKLQ